MTHSSNNKPPVLIVGFARLTNIVEIAERIISDKPCCLFVQIDGGKINPLSEDVAKLTETLLDLALDHTEVHINIEDDNLGIAANLSKGVGWALARHESIVVLEDDCYPSPIFYKFMSAALSLHERNREIGMISGNAYIRYSSGPLFAEVSNVPLTWGWGTWRDRWEKFDTKLSKFTPAQMNAGIAKYTFNPAVRFHWRTRVLDALRDRNMWDAQWSVYMWMQDYECLNPSENLIANVGIDDKAIHTFNKSIFSEWPASIRQELGPGVADRIRHPKRWSRTRRLRHESLQRLNLVDSLVRRLSSRAQNFYLSRIALIIASCKNPHI